MKSLRRTALSVTVLEGRELLSGFAAPAINPTIQADLAQDSGGSEDPSERFQNRRSHALRRPARDRSRRPAQQGRTERDREVQL